MPSFLLTPLHAFVLPLALDPAKDPHGWILTLTSVSVVFGALLILWFIFSVMGQLNTRALAKKAASVIPSTSSVIPSEAKESSVVTGIGTQDRKDMTPKGECRSYPNSCPSSTINPEVAAAIVVALDAYLAETTHDGESFVITIRPTGAENHWGAPGRNFRKTRV